MRKVGRIALHLGEGWEEVMRLCLLAMGDARGRIRSAETIWRDPETQNEAVRTDAVLKQFQAGRHRPRDRAGAAGLLARAGAPDARAAAGLAARDACAA